jgi:hypothetical protein
LEVIVDLSGDIEVPAVHVEENGVEVGDVHKNINIYLENNSRRPIPYQLINL